MSKRVQQRNPYASGRSSSLFAVRHLLSATICVCYASLASQVVPLPPKSSLCLPIVPTRSPDVTSMSADMANTPTAPSFPRLNEHNYHTWKFDIQAQLQRNGTWKVVSGRLPKPSPRPAGVAGAATAESDDQWYAMNENAAGIIYSVVEPSIQSLIRDFLDDSVGMWKKLKETYAQENAASRFLILDEFLSVSKGADESLTALCA